MPSSTWELFNGVLAGPPRGSCSAIGLIDAFTSENLYQVFKTGCIWRRDNQKATMFQYPVDFTENKRRIFLEVLNYINKDYPIKVPFRKGECFFLRIESDRIELKFVNACKDRQNGFLNGKCRLFTVRHYYHVVICNFAYERAQEIGISHDMKHIS